MKRNFFGKFVTTFAMCLLVVCGAMGQAGTTSIHGVVTDKTGATVAAAKVTIDNPEQNLSRSADSGSAGEFDFVGLQPGTYVLTVEASGFRKFERKGVQLLVNVPTTVNVALEVGSSTQTVEVSAATETLNTTDASLGNAFNENQVKQLPLEGRNVPDLLSLQPGVAYTGNRADVPAFDTRSGAVNGARSDQSNVTVDGIASNDEGGKAFSSVLPVTLDSVQEFRVTTSNYNADQGGSSGAQVALVTKSGTNSFHGSLYEYHRNTFTSANDYFIKAAQLNAGEPNAPPKLIRNIFGGSLGGPIIKDRLYFFTNYEGTRRVEATSQTDQVPSQTMRDGIIEYPCDGTSGPCPGGTVTGISGKSYQVAPGNFALGPTQLAAIDPLHIGPNAAVVQYLNTWPTPNCSAVGDGLNYTCFNFSAPITDTENVYIAKLDYNITKDGKHRMSVSGALQNENHAFAPFLPTDPPSQDLVNYSKGIIGSYNAVISNNLVNNFRYGFVRQSVGSIGNSNQDWVFFRGLNDATGAVTRSTAFQRPTHNFVDDVSWTHGKHTFQFGTQIAVIREPRVSTRSSFSQASANASWVDTAGYAGRGSPLNPATSGLPGVDSSFANSYDYPIQALLGIVTEVDAKYNFQKDGTALPDGTALKRRFGINSYEFYAQDTWKIKPSFTLTLGLRYSLFSPPWETNGVQVIPNVYMSQWFAGRGDAGAAGIPSANDPPVSFDFGGKANGKPGYYDWDYHNFGPRVAFAWAPHFSGGLLGDVFGTGKTAIRGGFGMVYDRFGQGIIDDFDSSGSFGLSTTLTNPAAVQTVSSAPRVTDIHTIPHTDNDGNPIFIPAPVSTFPQTFPDGTYAITNSLDRGLKTPYEYTLDLSVARELKGGFTLEVAYVGRLSHSLLTQQDAATPLNFKDPGSGTTYFTAVDALAKLYRNKAQGGAGVTDGTFNNSMLPANVIKYWTDLLQPVTPGSQYALGASGGCGAGPAGTTNPVLAVFDLFCGSNLNETTGLVFLDTGSIGDINDPNKFYGPKTGNFTFYNPQYATLYNWRSMGTANYNAMQVTLKHPMTHGVQFDVNYTYSKSIDLASDAERVGTIGGIGGQIINAWDPYQFRAPSDFDATHQFNIDFVADLPFGRNRRFASNINRGLDAVIGGWQLSGLMRVTSGFPFSVFNGAQWPTDWDLSGNGILTGSVKTGRFHDPTNPDVVNVFQTGADAQSQFVEPLPGQAGQRNNFRGDGYFSTDLSLSKRWILPWGAERHSLQLRWEVFNVTNSVRFDVQSLQGSLDSSGSSFGQYTRLSTNPRVMQFALRYEF